MDVSLVYKGFIHPLSNHYGSAEDISIWARIQRLFVVAKLARAPGSLELVRAGGGGRRAFYLLCPNAALL